MTTELFVGVSHFTGQPYNSFGDPFFIRLRDGDSREAVREAVRARLGLEPDEFDRLEVCAVDKGRKAALGDVVRVRDFKLPPEVSPRTVLAPYIGVGHKSKPAGKKAAAVTMGALQIRN